jgi:hypothetical protein
LRLGATDMGSRIIVVSRGASVLVALLLFSLVSPRAAPAQRPMYDYETITELTDRCELAHSRGFWHVGVPQAPHTREGNKCSNDLNAYRCISLIWQRSSHSPSDPGIGRLIKARHRFASLLAQNRCNVTPFSYADVPARPDEIKEGGGIWYRQAESAGPPRTKCWERFPGPPKAFWDPIKGGSCWTCPAGFGRTVFAVNGPTACEKGGPFGQHRAATEMGKPNGCPTGSTLISGICRRCPSGFKLFHGFPKSPKEILDVFPAIDDSYAVAWCSPNRPSPERRQTTALPRPRRTEPPPR